MASQTDLRRGMRFHPVLSFASHPTTTTIVSDSRLPPLEISGIGLEIIGQRLIGRELITLSIPREPLVFGFERIGHFIHGGDAENSGSENSGRIKRGGRVLIGRISAVSAILNAN